MSDNLISRLRTSPKQVAESYARGLVDFWRFRPDLRRLYSTGDVAYVESLAKQAGRLDYNKALIN